MATENKMGAPWKPLTGLIDPFTSGPNSIDKHSLYDTSKELTKEKPDEKIVEQFVDTPLQKQNTNSSTGIEKIFIYVAILLCIAIIVSILYYIFNNYLFHSLVLVFVSIVLYTLLYIANFKDIENTNTHTKITSGVTIVILVFSVLMLLIIVKNKRRFT